jgi:superfamily I DNA/RNA helicase/RecB family exonuclease
MTVALDLRTGLSSAQEEVVAHEGGPLLVLGGPGSGKTHALEQRYLRLASSPGLAPHRVLYLCTNRRYSMEAKDRLFGELAQTVVVDVPVYTWHALAYHLVSRHYPALGYRESPVLLTAAEQWGKVREMLAAEGPVDWGVWGDRLRDRAFVDEVADFCLRVTQRMMSADDLEAVARHRAEWVPVTRFYETYQAALQKDSRLDYAGLIAAAVRMLAEQPDLAETLRRRFPHVLVDEAEEMSRAQRELLMLLERDNLCVAADPDSGVEGFRGAEPEWVLGFERIAGPTRTVVLEEGHRLGEPLSAAAAGLAARNDPAVARIPPAVPGHATTFEARQFGSPAEEVDHIARELRRTHLFEGVAWDDMAVLVSQPAYLLGSLQRALARWEVPHRQLAGERPLGSEPAVAVFLDLVRVALGDEGWEAVLPGLLTSPLVGLGYAGRRRLERLAWQTGRSLARVLEDSPDIPEVAALARLRDLVVLHAGDAQECFWEVFNAAAYYRRLREADSAEASLQLDSLVAFDHALGRFVERRHGVATIRDYLNEAARADFGGDPWLPSVPTGSGRVAILSFHAAKGREWDTVVVAGCLDAWIPKGRRAQGLFDPLALEIADAADREVEAIAADRRTFYLAATRARRRVLFTVSNVVSGRGRPSRFLGEFGCEPVAPPVEDLPALTESEQRARLRRILEADPTSGLTESPEARVAALLALAELPGTDPGKWYGRWDWTEGAVPVEGEVLRTSYSRLSYYDNCGLQYLLVSVLGLDPSSTHSMKFGTWMHALFEAVHSGELTTPPALLERYRQYFDQSVFPNLTIARQFRRDGEKMLRAFWDYERRSKTVAVEHAFDLEYGSARLRGRIDRVDQIGDNKLRLTDYKTAKWAAGVNEAQESLQLALYYKAAREDPELAAYGTPIAARLVYPGATFSDGKPLERVQNPEQADKVLKRLPALVADIRNEKFAPSPVADCMWCAVKPMCPLWPQGSELK